MRQEISRLLNEYTNVKKEAFAGNPFGNFVRNEIPRSIYQTGLVDEKDYLVTGSVGQGNWAIIPWICIFDRAITTSATRGVYIVYLLSKDGNSIYLTFNQGCTDIRKTHTKKETIAIMREKANEIRSKIDARIFAIDDSATLGDKLTELGELYQEGIIFYKKYNKDNLPSEESLRQDLSTMMDIYREYATPSNTKENKRAWLLAWNPSRWEWNDYDEAVNLTQNGGVYNRRWSCQNTQVKKGDLVFMTIVGSSEYKGIVAAGMALSESYKYEHWDPQKAKKGIKENKIDIGLNWIIDFKNKPYLRQKYLKEKYPNQHWTPQSSGIEIKQEYIDLLVEDWNRIKGESTVEISSSNIDLVKKIIVYVSSNGFTYADSLIENFYLSLKSKPFVILAGTSGTGKTRLVRLFAEAINAHYKMVPVRPDWSDSSDLFGHVDLNGNYVPGEILEFIAKAQKDPNRPYILCLDEMNLARVEYYLSDFLSVIETREVRDQVEFFAIIRKIYKDFIKAADMILRNPHHQLQTEHEVQPWHKVRRTDNRTLRWLEKHPEYAKRNSSVDLNSKGSGTVLAERALAVRKYVTYDTKENRLTKFMLEQTARRLEHFKSKYCQLNRQTDQEIISLINTMLQGINRRCNVGFMREVSPLAADSGMSLVFGMAPGYRELYRCYLMLQHGLTVTGSVFNISLKDLAVLYEYWCFIKLNRLMKDRYELISPDIIQVNGAGLYVALEKGMKSEVQYMNPRTGERITLAYNKSETGLPTVAQKPDNILSLEKKGANVTYEYVFDAKYRIDPAKPGTYYHDTLKADTPGPMIDDINTMHRYRDAIVYQNGASPYERTMFGAYILFPYHNEDEYKNHRFYKSIEQVNIGGLPFLPSATSLVTEMLEELVSDSPDSAFERATLPRGIEEKLAKVDWKRRDVLVGTLRGPEHLSACLENRSFIISPSRINEENFPIRYVALYETEAAFGDEAKIELYGEVKTVRLVRGKDISESFEVASDDELYYQLEIKSWRKLKDPIMPKEFGFTLMFTNLFLLQHSSQVNELFLRSEEEFRLYSELKRRTDKAAISEDDEGRVSGFEFENNKIMFVDGEIRMISGDKVVDKCTIVEFSNRPGAMFKRLMGYWEKMK